jgi:hypothetical protein
LKFDNENWIKDTGKWKTEYGKSKLDERKWKKKGKFKMKN